MILLVGMRGHSSEIRLNRKPEVSTALLLVDLRSRSRGQHFHHGPAERGSNFHVRFRVVIVVGVDHKSGRAMFAS